MEMKSKYYVVRDRALPEVLLKVAKVKRLLDADKAMTVQEASGRLGGDMLCYTEDGSFVLDVMISCHSLA